MKSIDFDSSLLNAIKLEQNETIAYQGAPNLRQSIWHCYRVLFNVSLVFFLLGSGFAFFKYHVSFFWLQIAFAIYLLSLFLLSLIDAYTDRDVYYCITDRRVIKLKGGRIEKQLRFDEITKITHKERDGQGFFIFTGAKAGSSDLTAISVLGIDRVKAVYTALPVRLKEIADTSNKSLLQ
ncbi:MAG: hypothetical protein SFY67_19370 [Candidatus Melainabacteria bacterium]|nr:hypothetical protein [Candidatus Melainabacteria bacterium]